MDRFPVDYSLVTTFIFLVVGIPLFTALLIGSIGIYFPQIIRALGLIGVSFGFLASFSLFNHIKVFYDYIYIFYYYNEVN